MCWASLELFPHSDVGFERRALFCAGDPDSPMFDSCFLATNSSLPVASIARPTPLGHWLSMCLCGGCFYCQSDSSWAVRDDRWRKTCWCYASSGQLDEASSYSIDSSRCGIRWGLCSRFRRPIRSQASSRVGVPNGVALLLSSHWPELCSTRSIKHSRRARAFLGLRRRIT